ncbi:hypothetical protein [Herbaspirillum seropedicae]|uniref:hypothetical protein n=1 Tax=Herbaspirillum seropedicae TaxID=964 RepID=UPI0031DD4BC3
MSINNVTSTYHSNAYTNLPTPAKKPAVSFTDVLNSAGQPAVGSNGVVNYGVPASQNTTRA